LGAIAGPGQRERVTPRFSIEPRRDLHKTAKEGFIRTVADTLAAELKEGKFN